MYVTWPEAFCSKGLVDFGEQGFSRGVCFSANAQTITEPLVDEKVFEVVAVCL